MTTQATGSFTIDNWDQEAFGEDTVGVSLSRALVTKTFVGDLDGTSVTHLLLAKAQVETSAGYGGFEVFTGTLAGTPGSFVLHHHATTADGERSMTWSVLPDSGTDGLRSIRGEGQIIAGPDGHTFTLDYQL